MPLLSEDRVSSPSSVRYNSPVTSAVSQDDDLPQTPQPATMSKQEDVRAPFKAGFKSLVELEEAYLAARFELAEQMLPKISVHSAEKKAREMEHEIAKAMENLAKMGIEVGGNGTATTE